MSERLKFEGRLRRLETEAKKLESRLAGELRAVRNILDPFKPPAEVDFGQAANLLLPAANMHITYMGMLKEIALLKRELGLD